MSSRSLTHGALALRQLAPSDLSTVAAIHRAAFPHCPLTNLGRETVRRYYEWLLLGPQKIDAEGAFLDADLVGFYFAGSFRGVLPGFLRINRVFLVGTIVMRPWLLANPLLWRTAYGMLRAWKHRRAVGVSVPKHDQTPASSFGVLVLAVAPPRPESPIGRRLTESAETTARRRGFREIHLTVHPANDQALDFYKELHWKQVPQDGPWKGRIKKTLG